MRVTVVGHLPLTASVLVTLRPASEVQLSSIAPKMASRPATVVSAAGTAVTSQPLIVLSLVVVAAVGTSVSFRVNVAESVAEQPLLSVTVTLTAYSWPQSGLMPVTVVASASKALASLLQV